MLLGKILAEAAMRENKFVTLLPAYGAEVRGGTAHCMVVISDKEIGSPYVNKPGTLIIMNGPSLTKFNPKLAPNGLMIVNSSLAPANANNNGHILRHPFTDIAIKLGNIRVANVIALGCLIANKHIVKPKSVIQAIQDLAPTDKAGLVEINKRALEEGIRLK